MGLLYEGWMILAALIPSIGLLFLGWVILKHLIEGDRRERAAIRRWEVEQESAQHAAEASDKPSGGATDAFSDNGGKGPDKPGDPA